MSISRLTIYHTFRLALLIIVGGLVNISTAVARDEHARVVDGIGIYIGIVPCELIQGPERQMHGGVPAVKHCHHVMLALFDNASGKRIEDATVSARVREPGASGVSGTVKTLEPMAIAGAMTYGNFFIMPEPGPFLIDVQIQRPGSAHKTETQFEYRHFLP